MAGAGILKHVDVAQEGRRAVPPIAEQQKRSACMASLTTAATPARRCRRPSCCTPRYSSSCTASLLLRQLYCCTAHLAVPQVDRILALQPQAQPDNQVGYLVVLVQLAVVLHNRKARRKNERWNRRRQAGWHTGGAANESFRLHMRNTGPPLADWCPSQASKAASPAHVSLPASPRSGSCRAGGAPPGTACLAPAWCCRLRGRGRRAARHAHLASARIRIGDQPWAHHHFIPHTHTHTPHTPTQHTNTHIQYTHTNTTHTHHNIRHHTQHNTHLPSRPPPGRSPSRPGWWRSSRRA